MTLTIIVFPGFGNIKIQCEYLTSFGNINTFWQDVGMHISMRKVREKCYEV